MTTRWPSVLLVLSLLCVSQTCGQLCSSCTGIYRPPGPHINVNTTMAGDLTETIELDSSIVDDGANFTVHLNFTSDYVLGVGDQYAFSGQLHDSPSCNASSVIFADGAVFTLSNGGFWVNFSKTYECQTLYAVVFLNRLMATDGQLWIEKNTTVPGTMCFPLETCCPMMVPPTPSATPAPTPNATLTPTPTPTPIDVPSPTPIPDEPTPAFVESSLFYVIIPIVVGLLLSCVCLFVFARRNRGSRRNSSRN